MSGNKNQEGGDGAQISVRAAAIALVSDLDRSSVLATPAIGISRSTERLRLAIANERSALLDIEHPQLAADGIELMKRGEPVSGDHVRAIVAAAEAAIANEASGRLRWDATMLAIKRWQEGDALSRDARELLGEVRGFVEHEYPALTAKIDALLAESVPGARAMMWPDHADLLVWLIELVEHVPACPSIHEVAETIGQLRHLYSGSPIIQQAADRLEGIANALVASSRRVLKAEGEAAQFRKIAMGADPRVYDSLRSVLQRPDVQEAIAKALCADAGGDWEAALESGRDAFRQAAERLLAGAREAPRSG